MVPSVNSQPQLWQPNYRLTPPLVNSMLDIERAKTSVTLLPLPVAEEAKLRFAARVRATHYSTFIEGNRLTLAEVEQVIRLTSPTVPVGATAITPMINGEVETTERAHGSARGFAGTEATDGLLYESFPGRERDVTEVSNYWEALLKVEDWAATGKKLTEKFIQQLHGIVESGPRARPTQYRTAQNAIRESGSRSIIYLPPEAKDVPELMAGLVAWAAEAERQGLPAPLVAALVHYQFVTIHPYMDGNGRTGRLLSTFILHRAGYDLKGFYSLEEHYVADLGGYYGSLETHPHHNYYMGRATADLTAYLEYFLSRMALTFQAVQKAAEAATRLEQSPMPDSLRRLDPRARRIIGLFASRETITSLDVAGELGLSQRMARNLLARWTKEGWLEVADASRRARSYRLAPDLRQHLEARIADNAGNEGA